MVEKSLDLKLARIKADPSCRDFLIADAKDADMAFGIAAPGKSPEMHAHEGRFRSLGEYRDNIRAVVRQGVVDIMLMSAHTNSVLTIEERLFEDSHVTPAARANDTTDIHVARGGVYPTRPSCPFQSTTIDQIQCGHIDCRPEERVRGANLGLYSVTFNNDTELDRRTLEAYKSFRIEAERKGFRHFLEVFDPNAPVNPIDAARLGGFVNDMIVRALAGVPESGRPLFLKLVYHGPKYTEELASYDPSLVIGVLGGSAGTTYDAFKLIAEAQRHGARVALFGRKINNAEHQLAFVAMLRHIVDGELTPEEAVHAYHGVLEKLEIAPHRRLEDDLQLTDTSMQYAGARASVTVPARRTRSGTRQPAPDRPGTGGPAPRPSGGNGRAGAAAPASLPGPDIKGMSSEQRLAYFRARLRGVTA